MKTANKRNKLVKIVINMAPDYSIIGGIFLNLDGTIAMGLAETI